MTRKFLTRREVAKLYPLTVGQLARWASRGTGPTYYLRGRALYDVEELEKWLVEGEVNRNRHSRRQRGRGRPKKTRAAS